MTITPVKTLARAADAARQRLARFKPTRVPLAYKFSLAIAVLIVIGMTGLGLFILGNQTDLLRSQINTFGRTIVHQLADSATDPVLTNDTLSLEVMTTNLARNPAVLGTAVVSPEGDVLASAGINPFKEGAPLSGRLPDLTGEASRNVEWQWPDAERDERAGVTLSAPIRFQDVTAGHVLISFDRTVMTRSLEDSTQAIIVATVVMVVLGIVMSFMIGTRLSEPISQLMRGSRAIGSGNYNYRFQDRRNDEIGNLMTAFNDMAKGMLEKRQVESIFSRYVSSSVAREVLADLDRVELGGQRVHATVLFADIVGFTRMSEDMQPHAVAEMLNEYFSYIARVGSLYNGTIDKYMGDCAMLVFGAPEPDEEHAFHAVACGLLIQRVIAELNEQRAARGDPAVRFRIGINSGEMLAGNMGAADRMQYTVVGDAVNLASRLCSVAEPDQVIISHQTRVSRDVRARTRTQAYKAIRLRGVSKPMNTYRVEDVSSVYRRRMDQEVREIVAWGEDTPACQRG